MFILIWLNRGKVCQWDGRVRLGDQLYKKMGNVQFPTASHNPTHNHNTQ